MTASIVDASSTRSRGLGFRVTRTWALWLSMQFCGVTGCLHSTMILHGMKTCKGTCGTMVVSLNRATPT